MKNKEDIGVDIFRGNAAYYDTFRIEPPDTIVEILNKVLVDRPERVVDLGCGTGLSTMLWAGWASEVIGIEPNPDMRNQAMKVLNRQPGDTQTEIRFEDGKNSDVGLPDAHVDIVTCCQSLHWMEPETTHPEILRVLRPGGVLAAFSYAMPPTVHPVLEQAFQKVLYRANALVKERKIWVGLQSWSIVEHHKYMQGLDEYGYTKEIWFHQKKMGNADDFMGLVKSYGSIDRGLKGDVSESELGLDRLRGLADEVIGQDEKEWIFGYRMIVGKKKDVGS